MLPYVSDSQNQAQQTNAPRSFSVIDLLKVLWKGKLVMLLFALIGAAVGFYQANWATVMFTSDALVQINIKGGGTRTAAAINSSLGNIIEESSPAAAEITLLKSRLILSKVVEEMHLRYGASPISTRKERILHRQGRMDVDFLDLPGHGWKARALSADSFVLVEPKGNVIAHGVVGETVGTEYKGDSVFIKVSFLKARVGENFALNTKSELSAISSLTKSLSIMEEGKGTGVLKLTMTHQYADKAASILNAVLNIYLRQNVEMRSAEAEKTLAFLEEQLPGVKAKLDSAEYDLAKYQRRVGTVDISGETSNKMSKSIELQNQIAELEQQKKEALRVYKEDYPTIKTMDIKLKNLQHELGKIRGSLASVPEKQQELVRLQEEVSINNNLYTNMLNNMQQLKVVRAGEVGNVRIVDYARISENPSAPNKRAIEVQCLAIFLGIGAVLLILISLFSRKGLVSTSEIENATGVSVYGKIPESKNKLLKKFRRHSTDRQFLVVEDPDDLTSEAFRSLLTAVDFAIDKHQILMVSGLIPGAGKSFVAENLAALAAQMGRKVLLVDGDMRRGRVKSKSHNGLANVLMRTCSKQDAIAQGMFENLFVMGAGHTQIYPSELLRGNAFKALLDEVRTEYDLVIVDTPPLNLITDASLIYPLVDFALLVLYYGKHSITEVQETLKSLDRVKNVPKAFALNHCERHRHGYGYYGYYGGYYKKKK